MKSILFFVLTLTLSFAVYADEKSTVVLNHLMTIGRNDQGFEKLPEKLKLNGWTFENYPPNFYYVTGPEGIRSRKYEYILEKGKITGIAMTGGHEQIMLYKKDACVEAYKASLSIKADESLRDEVLDIFTKHKITGPSRDPKDLLYGRKYAQDCKLIFSLDQEQTLRQMVPGKKGSR